MYTMELTLTTLSGQVVDEVKVEHESLYCLNCLQKPIIRQFYDNGHISINTDYILHTLIEKEGEYEDSEELGVLFFYDPMYHNTKIRTEDGFEFEI